MIAIESTSCCNHNCIHCPFRIDSKKIPRGLMELEMFKKIVDENPSEEIAVFNRGEPFLHPDIYEMIEYAQQKAKVVISTNGVLVDPKKLYDVFHSGTLCISFPAGRRDTFEEITGFDNFDKVKEATESLQWLLESPTIDLYVKMVSLPQNQGQDALLREFCKKVVVVDDSNQPNPKGYTTCTQPDVCPTWTYDGKKKICCRDEFGKYDWDKYYEQGKKRELDICKKCGIC